jgi:Fic family protein
VAGITKPAALAGYRNVPIFIKGSRYAPPRSEVVPDAMTAYFDLLEAEKEASVRAVLGHWLFGFIHPYQDGNGRIARFVMNAMLASGGYPWTVIRVEDREAYLKALDSASIATDIGPFAEFIATRVKAAMTKAAKEASKKST